MTNTILESAWGRTILAKRDEPTGKTRAADMDHIGRIDKICADNGLKPQDIADVVVFLQTTPVAFAGQPQQAVVESFRSWWGGALPLPWRKMDDINTAQVVWSVNATLPMFVEHLQGIDEKKDKQKSASIKTSANGESNAAQGILFGAMVARLAKTVANITGYIRDRVRKKRKIDNEYDVGKRYWSEEDDEMVREISIWSAEKDKIVKFKEPMRMVDSTRPNKPGDWGVKNSIRKTQYENYKWACKVFDVEPVSDTAYFAAFNGPPKDIGDWSRRNIFERAIAATKGDDATQTAARAEVKDIIDNFPSHKKKWDAEHRKDRIAQYLDESIQMRYNAYYVEEMKSPRSFLDRIPVMDTILAESRAKKRVLKEESARTYDDYLESKRKSGAVPLSKEDWEARYGKKANIRLAAAWGRTIL